MICFLEFSNLNRQLDHDKLFYLSGNCNVEQRKLTFKTFDHTLFYNKEHSALLWGKNSLDVSNITSVKQYSFFHNDKTGW